MIRPRFASLRRAACALAALVAFIQPAQTAGAEKEGEAQPATARAERQEFKETLNLDGVLVATDVFEYAFWPKAYRGELRILEAKPAGTTVTAGDMLVRFDTAPIDRMIEDTAFDLDAQQRRFDEMLEEHRMADAAAANEMERAEMDLRHALADHENLLKFDVPFRNADYEFGVKGTENWIADQEEELKQLGSMYTEDELTEATEEIVLMRARRDLERSKQSYETSKKKRQYWLEQKEPAQLERAALEVEHKQQAHARIKRTHEIRAAQRQREREKAERDLARKQEDLAKLEADRQQFTVTANRAGVVIHGAAENPEGQKLKEGGTGSTFQALVSVAGAAGFRVDFKIPESKVLRVPPGGRVVARPVALEGRSVAGRIERVYSVPAGAKDKEALFAAQASLAEPDSRLLAGMRCALEIELDSIPDALVVPKQAVTTKDGKSTLKVKLGDQVEERAIELGPTNDTCAVIWSGVGEGEEVVLGAGGKP